MYFFLNTHESAYYALKKEWGKEPLHVDGYITCYNPNSTINEICTLSYLLRAYR